ncbi:MerR family transcriptional regulator [Ensifer sp. ENS09]|nr:MerR family transcriptional regulator [Ensifer sp. ENS09]
MTDSYFLAGRFGAATRLSPKALRLYAEQGLLVPAHVDPITGYRYYAATQASRARLIARLRQLGLPIARIARLIDLQPDVRLTELRAWLEVQSKRLEDQRELVEAIIRQSSGGDDPLVMAVAVRDVAPSKIVYRQNHVTVDARGLHRKRRNGDPRLSCAIGQERRRADDAAFPRAGQSRRQGSRRGRDRL